MSVHGIFCMHRKIRVERLWRFSKEVNLLLKRLEDGPRVNFVMISWHGNRDKARRIHAVPVAEIQNVRLVIPSVDTKRLTNRVLQACPRSVKLDVKNVAIVFPGCETAVDSTRH